MDGNRLSGEGKLDLAAERFFAALRVASHLGHGTSFRSGEIIEGWAYDGLRYWSAASGQTPERIKAAIKQIDAITQTRPSRDEAIKAHHMLFRSIILGKNTGDGRSFSDFHGDWISYKWNSLPWEKARLLRMLNRTTAHDLESLKNMGDPAIYDERTVPLFASLPSQMIVRSIFNGKSFFRVPSQISGNYGQIAFYELNTRTVRRATKIVLALEAWKLQHGELPKSLGELVGPYFKTLPTPPRAGTVFAYFPKGFPKTLWAYPPQAGNYGPYERAPFGPNRPLLLVCVRGDQKTGVLELINRSELGPGDIGDFRNDGFAFPIPKLHSVE